MGQILIGTSGFSYDDWRGFFYPRDIEKSQMLSYYAGKFTAVEVNASYYTIPPPTTFRRMAQKTRAGFRFTVKANKDITHSPDVDLSALERFRAAVEPLCDAGKLGCILAQYPWSFKKNQVNADRVRQLGEGLAELPLVVEFRNGGWIAEDAFALLRENNLGFCCVDEPKLRGLMPSVAVVTSDVAYVRFHGRNAEKWWQHDEAWERYDYLYSRRELEGWIAKIRSLVSSAKETYLFFNNHYQGKAARNAQLFATMLEVKLPDQG